MKIKIPKSTYEKLVDKYGEPETNSWGVKTFEFINDESGNPYQFVLEAKTKKPIEKRFTKYLGQQNGMHFYREKGKTVSITDTYSPSVW